jgi:hypothetical protein
MKHACLHDIRVPLVFFALAVLWPALSRGQAAPDFSGHWTINRSLSDDAAAKIAEVAGPDTVSGARTFGGQVFFPHASYGKDVDRLDLRQFLLDAVASLDATEIRQRPDELKSIHGDEVRIFYFKRASSGESVAGATLTRRIRWQGEQLVLESEGEKTKLIEVLTLVPARNQLIEAVRYEADVFKKPLELKLVYDRAPRPNP